MPATQYTVHTVHRVKENSVVLQEAFELRCFWVKWSLKAAVTPAAAAAMYTCYTDAAAQVLLLCIHATQKVLLLLMTDLEAGLGGPITSDQAAIIIFTLLLLLLLNRTQVCVIEGI